MKQMKQKIINRMRKTVLARLARRLFSKSFRTALKNADPNEPFDPEFYFKRYPDLQASGYEPWEHYINHGKAEGRIGVPPVLTYSGRIEGLSSTRKTVLVVSHEASRTGAPVLSLNLIRELKKKYNVVAILLGDGPIVEDFRQSADIVIGPLTEWNTPESVAPRVSKLLGLTKISFAIVNSIESRSVLPELARHFVPSISLIHEFAAYTRPLDAFREIFVWSTEIVFSTRLTHENAVAEFPELGDCRVHIRPQGRCTLPSIETDATARMKEEARVRNALRPPGLAEDAVVVLGAGFVQMRKGVDMFLECAARVVHAENGRHCRFVWIGKGYDPLNDMAYSVYLADQIRRSGLEQHVFFMKETSSIETAYQTADLLLISSRLDPLPNVAIDAMVHALPVICFDRTTGIADILSANGFGEACVAPYFDTAEMAARVLALANSKALRQDLGERLRALALAQFDMPHYVEQLEELGRIGGEHSAQEKAAAEQITASGLFRLDFYLPLYLKGAPQKEAILRYVRGWAATLGRRKPFPGFHPGIYLERNGMHESAGDPFANYLQAGQPPGPWRVDVIGPKDVVQPLPAGARIALHLHVYYLDLLPEILTRLNRNQVRPDLFVSVPTEKLRDDVQAVLKNYSGKLVEIQVVPNRGRDIGPFLTAFGATLLDRYDLVGHLHTKKTADIEDLALGRNWYLFLLENLLGGKASMADIILGRMAADPSIGIVFPDDPNVVGWSKNKPHAEALCERLGLASLPENFLFPVGTMFWARVDSIRAILELGLGWKDYPEEPLPYDGSILHALERLLPLMVPNRGARVVVTNVNGVTR
jgi:glycosyltransferase involved in cell wall biosynthesis